MFKEKRKQFIFAVCAFVVCMASFASTETVKWYIDGELYETTTCESGGDITTPTLPERFGSTFQGWAPAIYDMSTLDTSINSSVNSYNKDAHSWNVTFSYGTVYGEALCSTTPNSPREINDGFDTTYNGQFCYFRVTDFVPTGSPLVYEPVATHWEYCSNETSLFYCHRDCIILCIEKVKNNSAFRTALFGN